MHVQEDDVRAEFFRADAGGESAFADLDFVLRFVFEDLLEDLDDVLLVIDDEDARRAGHEAVQRHAVLLHETDQLIQRDAAVLAAGDAIPVQGAGIEPLADGSRCDAADLRDFAGGQNIFDLGRRRMVGAAAGAHGILSLLRKTFSKDLGCAPSTACTRVHLFVSGRSQRFRPFPPS
jgi:hypothetical protein